MNTKEVYTYNAPWPVYALNWSQMPGTFRLAFGSFFEEYANKLKVVQMYEPTGELVKVAEIDHPYPVTKTMFTPFKGGRNRDLLATTGDYLRIWELALEDEDDRPGSHYGNNISNNGVGSNSHMGHNAYGSSSPEGGGSPDGSSNLVLRASMANLRRGMGPSAKKEFIAPLTSMDWNEVNTSLCVTSSVDTTCTVWDINTQQAKTQLIAHDKEVYDVAFARGTDVFASVGADGSVRMFDLRALEHSTIIYETPMGPSPTTTTPSTPAAAAASALQDNSPLVRIAWNKQDSNYVATVQMDSPAVLILDIRVPAIPVTELVGRAAVNAIGWAPHSSAHLCSAGDDHQALIWDVSQLSSQKQPTDSTTANTTTQHGAVVGPLDPVLCYQAPGEVNQMSWSNVNTEWIAVAYGSTVQALRV